MTNLHLSWPKKKLNDKWTGPFKIVTKKGASAYMLKLLPAWCIHPTFNEVLLTPYHDPEFPNQQQLPPPPPDLVDRQEVYEVEKILDSWTWQTQEQKGKGPNTVMDYFVKWKGYRPESNSWVKETEMDTDELIEEFKAE